ncbi:DUF4232 domain-containing protein [Streptomyces sp. MBT27]|uniref:DUF4232 domain-containing protein n=1 Tax=Streptomyces sp. MBT27 TaxID=1488356 RepID=UPI001969851E|nr:DUF4232 domain-containing protein [Streptomyces sp. MBT27]
MHRERGAMRGGRGSTAVGGLVAVVLLGALTGCTDRVPAAAPATSVKSVAHGSSAPGAATPRERPIPSGSASGTGAPGQSASPGTGAGAGAVSPSGSASASPTPGAPGPGTHTGPVDDGGEDARIFCSPTALSFAFRVVDPAGRAGPRHGPDARTGDARAGDARAGADAVLVARNTSGHTCVLHGTPTLTVLDGSGRGAPLVSTPAQPFAKPFALHPGANGVARVHYSARRGCPATGTAVRVTLPGSDAAITVPVLDGHGRPAALALCGPAPRTGPFKPGFG